MFSKSSLQGIHFWSFIFALHQTPLQKRESMLSWALRLQINQLRLYILYCWNTSFETLIQILKIILKSLSSLIRYALSRRSIKHYEQSPVLPLKQNEMYNQYWGKIYPEPWTLLNIKRKLIWLGISKCSVLL